jgi:hypothetical protein
MKKIFLTLGVIFCVLTNFAQYQKSDLVLNQDLYKHYSQTEIEQMYQQDFVQLFKLNFMMSNFAMFGAKHPGGNTQDMGYLEKYAKPGVTVDEAEIIRTGRIDPLDFDLPQDENRINLFTLHKAGYYIFVASRQDYNRVLEANLNQYAY